MRSSRSERSDTTRDPGVRFRPRATLSDTTRTSRCLRRSKWLRDRDSDKPLCLFVGSQLAACSVAERTGGHRPGLGDRPAQPRRHRSDPTSGGVRYLGRGPETMDHELGAVDDAAREMLGDDVFFSTPAGPRRAVAVRQVEPLRGRHPDADDRELGRARSRRATEPMRWCHGSISCRLSSRWQAVTSRKAIDGRSFLPGARVARRPHRDDRFHHPQRRW